MPAQTYEVPAAWGASPYVELDLPSGGKILAKRLAFEDVIAAGLMDEFDTLTPVAEEKVVGPAKGKRPQDRKPKKLTKAQDEAKAASNFLKDKESAKSLMRVLALMLPQLVMQPPIYPHLEQVDGEWRVIHPDDRIEGRVYVDSIPMQDQMHIFSWAMEGMDTTKLQQFREQPEPDLGAVESVEVTPVKAEPTSGS